MATQVIFKKVDPLGFLGFQFDDAEDFIVKSFNEGVMVIQPMYCTIQSLAKHVAGCFEEGSNFNGLKAIEFDFNGVHISVTAKNADPQKIVKFYHKEEKKNRI